MAGKLLIIDGPAAGGELSLEEGQQWALGRDPDQCQLVLEDPAISRVHLRLQSAPEGIEVENASSTNPALLNGTPLAQAPELLKEGDVLQLGNTTLRYTLSTVPTFQTIWEGPPTESVEIAASELEIPVRFILKVVSGPNAGAESPLEKGRSYLLGTDGEVCDIVFFDLSVSAKHARLSVTDEETLLIEDLKSRNGVLIDGQRIEESSALEPNAMVSLGTTSFFVMDRESARQTIMAPSLQPAEEAAKEAPEPVVAREELVRPKGQLPVVPLIGALLGILLFVGAVLVGVRVVEGLFREQPIAVVTTAAHPETAIEKTLERYPGVRFLYNPTTGKLFLMGHVTTSVDASELTYTLQQLPDIMSIDNHIVLDEQVWREMNQVLLEEGRWPGVSMHAPEPGLFVVTGYVKNEQQASDLLTFLTLHFDFMERMQDRVVVEDDLAAQISALLLNSDLPSISGSLTDGELTLSGVIGTDQADKLEKMVPTLQRLPGVRQVNNYVVRVAPNATAIDVTGRYPVTGSSQYDQQSVGVVIQGKILAVGDSLDEMRITEIGPDTVWLNRGVLKFKIKYNTH